VATSEKGMGGLSTSASRKGITFEVRRANGQVAWQKLVRWHCFNQNRARYEAEARKQERQALSEGRDN